MSFSSFYSLFFFFFNDTATTEIYTLSLHDALPISLAGVMQEKLALVEGARMAVVGTDPPELASEARRRAPTVVAGTGPGAQVRPDAAELDDGGRPRITWRQHAVTLPVVGFHQIENAMLALAVGRGAGAEPARGA